MSSEISSWIIVIGNLSWTQTWRDPEKTVPTYLHLIAPRVPAIRNMHSTERIFQYRPRNSRFNNFPPSASSPGISLSLPREIPPPPISSISRHANQDPSCPPLQSNIPAYYCIHPLRDPSEPHSNPLRTLQPSLQQPPQNPAVTPQQSLTTPEQRSSCLSTCTVQSHQRGKFPFDGVPVAFLFNYPWRNTPPLSLHHPSMLFTLRVSSFSSRFSYILD